MLIGIVDDDETFREAICSLLRSAGYETKAFDSAEAFLSRDRVSEPDCLVIDVRMPGLSGLEIQRRLHQMRSVIPTIVMSAHPDSRARVKALQQGAAAFLQKPFSDEALFGAIHSATGMAASPSAGSSPAA